MNVGQTLTEGRAHHQAGRFAEAEQCYLRGLQADERNVEALWLTALACRQQGKVDEAITYYRRTTELRPDIAEAQFDLGVMLSARQRFAEAETCFDRAVELRPTWAEAHGNLGAMQSNTNKPELAIASCRRAIAIKSDYADAYNNLGVLLAGQGKVDDAVVNYRHALKLKPEFADALNNLGAALYQQEKLDEAEATCRQALALRPDFVDALNNLGSVLSKKHRFAEAEACYRGILAIRPDYTKAYVNLGTLYEQQGKLDEAEASFRWAIELQPANAETHNNLAVALTGGKKLDGALDSLQQALAINPTFAEAHRNRALILLATGRLDEGWVEYEWRFRCKGFEGRVLDKPRWTGTVDANARVLLHTEQGLGDTLQFIRYAPLVKERAGEVIVECEPSLVRLVATCPGVDRVVARGEPLGEFDRQIPLLSLPGAFGTRLETIPTSIGYLTPDADLVTQRKTELGDENTFKVGIAWQGNVDHPKNRLRSVPLEHFAALAGVAGVRLFSLQVGAGREQLAQWTAQAPVVDLGDRLGDFYDTAALVRNLDLVITCDSAPAHLAGALGVPVWVALTTVPDWRWLLDREDSPWYPSMKLFRQKQLGDWGDVFERIRAELASRVDSASAGRPS